MKFLYVPLYRMAVNYSYSFGRRWSIIEQMLLVESAAEKRSAAELAALANVPHRLVVEALINLLRANWVEVRSDGGKILFAATPTGRRRAADKNLPERLQKDIRWDSVCVDRLTGHWMRTDDLDLVYDIDLPSDAEKLLPLLYTFEPNDAALRDLFRLNPDESLEPTAPQFRSPSMPYARVGIAFGKVQSGLASNAPLDLKTRLVIASTNVVDIDATSHVTKSQMIEESARDEFSSEDIIVGGLAHLELFRKATVQAKSTLVVHSCFLSVDTLRRLLPDLEVAAKRKVRVELLWGLRVDPEAAGAPRKLSDAIEVLATLPESVRGRIRLSQQSSSSHAKVLIYDDRETGRWTTIVGSCNFLSSDFDWMEVSLRTRSAIFTSIILSRLLSHQLPAVGNWSGTARRLNSIWSELKRNLRTQKEVGAYAISLVADYDHYACVALARDHAVKEIEITCDLYGLAAETSVLVPMETAASKGTQVRLQYTRPSKFLLEEGHEPVSGEIEARGISIKRADNVHSKYLAWDEDSLVITSFNWLATSADPKWSRGAEIGAFVEGPGIHAILKAKLRGASVNKKAQGLDAGVGPIPS